MIQQKMEYPRIVKDQVGLWLREAPRGSQKIVAQALNVSDRTLRSWKKSASKKRGRQPLRSSFSETKQILKEWRRQGYPGSRPVIKALPGVRVRRVREVIAEMKLRRRRRALKFKQANRTQVRVKKVGVVVTMDGATIQRGEDIIVSRDRGSLSVNADACFGSLRAEHTVQKLEQLKVSGRLPLVFCSDNGSPFCANIVETFLDRHKIIHLRSLPRVPQHNGSCENAVKELKQLLSEGLSVENACEILNKSRKRRQLGWKTTEEVDDEKFVQYNEESREKFYNEALLAIKQALHGTKSVMERRKAEREAILVTMERFDLITRTRGNRSCA